MSKYYLAAIVIALEKKMITLTRATKLGISDTMMKEIRDSQVNIAYEAAYQD